MHTYIHSLTPASCDVITRLYLFLKHHVRIPESYKDYRKPKQEKMSRILHTQTYQIYNCIVVFKFLLLSNQSIIVESEFWIELVKSRLVSALWPGV